MNSIPEIFEIEYNYSKKCSCPTKCKTFYRVNGIDTYCKKQLEQLAINILNTVNGTMIAQKNYNNRGWTTLQERAIIDFIQKNGVQFGTYRIIGEMIGKPREAVKRKVYQLEQQGRLKRNERKGAKHDNR